MNRPARLVASGIAVAALAPIAHAQWTVINLHPAGATESYAYGVGDGQQAGYAMTVGGIRHASLWSGTPASWVNLHPFGPSSASGSYAHAVGDGQQVGYRHGTLGGPGAGQFNAVLWSGTAASWVDLRPTGATHSRAYGVGGGQQVGWANGGGISRGASLWSGTAASWVSLHPTGATESQAWGVHAGQQVGTVGPPGATHASLWSGTPASWVDLHPAGATESTALSVQDGRQVGVVSLGGVQRASLWSGTAASWVDLHAFLPAGFTSSSANGISHDGAVTYVVGSGFNSTTGQDQALMWVGPAPGCYPDCNLSGALTVADFGCFQTKFVSGDPYADCNTDGSLTVADFGCFQTKFVTGCP